MGSAVALADSAGSVQSEYTYEAFGATTSTGVASSNPFQYTGRENDGTGLYYYRARYYHPALHRFIGEDPIGFAGEDVNLYAYTFNSPTNYIDPSGELGLAGACLLGAAANTGWDLGMAGLSGRKVTPADIIESVASGCASGLLGLGLGKALAKAASLADDIARGARLANRAAGLSQRAGANSVTTNTPGLRIRYDLAGKAHYNKGAGRYVDTPHVTTYSRHANPANPNLVNYSKEGTRAATTGDLRTVDRILRGRGL